MEPLGVNPFKANYCFDPDFVISKAPGPKTKVTTPQEVLVFMDKLQSLHKVLKSEMAYVQATQAEFANRSHLPKPRINASNIVWLLRKHIKMTQPSSKLDHKCLGNFKVLECIGTHAYHLELSVSMKVHSIFHISLLELCSTNLILDHIQPPPPPV